jgi:hypothetical protein
MLREFWRYVGIYIVSFYMAAGCGQSPSFTEEVAVKRGGSEATAVDTIPVVADGTGVKEEPLPPVLPEPNPNEEETVDVEPKEPQEPVSPVGEDEDEGRFTSSVKTNDGQTVTIDTFSLSESFPVTERLENSTNPLKKQDSIQSLGAARTTSRSILSRTAQNKTFQKTAPIRSDQSHLVDHVGKPIDMFVTVDDSESFTQVSIERTRSAVHKLIEDLNDNDWRLFLGGLEGVSGNYDRHQINKGTQTLAQSKAAADVALNAIFAEGSNGDERVVRSLNRLAFDYRGNDRDNAVHAYLVVTDAPNCKDRNNNESSACSRVVGQNDHHTFLQSANSNVSAHIRKHMQLVGAYYRQSSNPAVCGNADDVEVAGTTETLKHSSQFAEMSFLSERNLDPAVSSTAAANWVGDLCHESESLTWLTRFTTAVKTTAAKRFALTQAPDVFVAPDTRFNLALHQPLGTVLNSNLMSVRDTFIVVLDPTLTGNVTAVYHRQNNFRRTNYENLLSPLPENGTVQLVWAGSGPVDCVNAASFSGLDVSVKCRHTTDDLYLRDTDFLPQLEPGAVPADITVRYFNHVEPVTTLEITSADTIFADTVLFTSVPVGVNPALAAVTSLNSGRTLRYTFPSALPPGDYMMSFYDYAQTVKSFNLTASAATGVGSYLCYLPGAGVTASINAAEQVVVTPPNAAYPCTLNAAAGTVQYAGRIPVDELGNRSIAVAFKGFVSPIDVFALDYPPSNNKVKVSIATAAAPTLKVVLDEAEYQVIDNRVLLNDPLQPGENITLEYVFLPPLRSCFLLSGEAWKDHKYHVWYGPPGLEEKIEKARYTIEKKDQGQTICLEESLVDYGNRLVVGYVIFEKALPQFAQNP